MEEYRLIKESFPDIESSETPMSSKVAFRAELWAGVLDSPFHFFLFTSTSEAIEMVNQFQIEDSHRMNILGLNESEYQRLKDLDVQRIEAVF